MFNRLLKAVDELRGSGLALTSDLSAGLASAFSTAFQGVTRKVEPVFLTAAWRDLVMLNFEVEPSVLQPHVPRGTSLDDGNGTVYASIVAFSFLNTRVKGLAIPCHRDFEEINLRFYVKAPGPEGDRRGVVFIREVVPRRAIAAVARRVYNEPYVACPVRSTVTEPSGGQTGLVRYGWKHRGRWLTVGATFDGEPAVPPSDSVEAFIAEHYWGYNTQRDGTTMAYRVEHPPWRVWKAAAHTMDGDFGSFYGSAFGPALSRPPSSVFVAEGSPVVVRGGAAVP